LGVSWRPATAYKLVRGFFGGGGSLIRDSLHPLGVVPTPMIEAEVRVARPKPPTPCAGGFG
jgi:hypothetical protein